ncbi:MAG: SDR family NAD(P)-dependent oxidoreductase, partial [Nonomuraea sp.]|nr:SDR family NAD(P)-dependent oxidoreductase [Nonomuraea sp.]
MSEPVVPRTVLVTGGASGIGRGVAEAFAAAGDRVVIADLDEPRARAVAAGIGCDHVQVDVGDSASVEAAVAAVAAEHGTIDVLVNNAGHTAGGGPL